jgi:SAM-dependent methyltransferase
VNRRISGQAEIWPLQWLRDRLIDRVPRPLAVSVGCGTGALERDLVEKEICGNVTGIDTVEQPLLRASELASHPPFRGRITYERADALEFLTNCPERLDGVFFHASLHHFSRPHEIVAASWRSLKPGGILYLDEYVGPSRRQWNPFRLILPNLVYWLLPPGARRARIVRAPINREDPTEAIASNEIIPAVLNRFRVLESRGYGGNWLALIFPNLRRPTSVNDSSAQKTLDRSVQRLLRLENVLLEKLRVRSYHTVLLAEK